MAVEYIMEQVNAGVEVKLRGVKGSLYLHTGNEFVARMRPSSVSATGNIKAAWVNSTHPLYGGILDNWPFAIKSASGWQTRQQLRDSLPGAFWPTMTAEKFGGHTGIQQVARFVVDWGPA